VRAVVHLAAALAPAALAFAFGRWLRDLVRVAGFGPSRVRGLGGRVKV